MKKYAILFLVVIFFSSLGSAGEVPVEKFADAESNFRLVMQKLLDKYVDRSLSRDELFRAATAGMLASLNTGDETWNKLLSPRDLSEMQIDFTGKVIGIGATIKFEERTGYGLILKAIPNSPAEKAGLKADDEILSVDGRKFKGKRLLDLVGAIRGEAGRSVNLKILRDDKILNVSVRRETVPWTPVELEKINASTSLLTIGFFNEQSPAQVEEKLRQVEKEKVKNLIVDLRDNEGGGFEQAVKVAELFLPVDAVITIAKNREGQNEKFRAKKRILGDNVKVILLTNKGTFCGAELVTAALKENIKVLVVGEASFGKWNAQSVETLPNGYAIKYTIQDFESPQGHTFQGVGIKPDLEVTLPKDTDLKVLRSKLDFSKRLEGDTQLKAALELIKAG